MFTVAKPFNSVNRRFAEGDPVMPADIEPGSAMSFADLKDTKFIVSAKADYSAMTKGDLEAMAAERHLDISRAKTKADVIAEIEYADKAQEAVQTGNYDALLKGELERLALAGGYDISATKTKADLIELLQTKPAPVMTGEGVAAPDGAVTTITPVP